MTLEEPGGATDGKEGDCRDGDGDGICSDRLVLVFLLQSTNKKTHETFFILFFYKEEEENHKNKKCNSHAVGFEGLSRRLVSGSKRKVTTRQIVSDADGIGLLSRSFRVRKHVLNEVRILLTEFIY